MKKVMAFFLCAMILSFLGTALATQDDSVLSQNVKEADGTSGQNTNTGSGIKTGHIQDGAITDAKIAGPISAEKLAAYSGVRIVHKGATDGLNTFNTITDALNSITDNSETKRYVVVVMPGVYTENVVGKYYVDIIGQSRSGSIIKNSGEDYTVTMANMSIKNLTVEGNGVGGVILYDNSAVYDCNIKVQFGGKWWAYGISIRSPQTTVENTTITGGQITCGLDIFGISNNSSVVLRGITIQNCAQAMLLQTNNNSPLRISDVLVVGDAAPTIEVQCGHIEFYNLISNVPDAAVVIGANCGYPVVHCSSCSLSSVGINGWPRSAFLYIDNSSVSGISIGGSAGVRIGNSKIASVSGDVSNLKMVNCHDADYNPIVN